MSAGLHFDDNRKTFTAQFSVAGPRGPQGEQGIQGPKGDPGPAYTLTDADKEAIADAVADSVETESKVLIVSIDEDDRPDKTYAEIETAVKEGRAVFATYGEGDVWPLASCYNGLAIFEKTSLLLGGVTQIVVEKSTARSELIPAPPEAFGLYTEPWTFTLEDGTTVTKAVYVG